MEQTVVSSSFTCRLPVGYKGCNHHQSNEIKASITAYMESSWNLRRGRIKVQILLPAVAASIVVRRSLHMKVEIKLMQPHLCRYRNCEGPKLPTYTKIHTHLVCLPQAQHSSGRRQRAEWPTGRRIPSTCCGCADSHVMREMLKQSMLTNCKKEYQNEL